MGGATRFMTTPFPPLRPSLILFHCRFSSLSATPLRLPALSSSSNSKTHTPLLVNSFHSQASNSTYTLHSSPQQQHHHPWPEWTHFLNIVSNQDFSGPEHYAILPEDEFTVYEELPDDFVRAAALCLAFARARPSLLGLLPRRDIGAVVSNGTPSLFKSAIDTRRRMRTYLGTDESSVSECDKAKTVDLMKYILSYASIPTISPERRGQYITEVDSSIQNLLRELGTIIGGVPTDYMPTSGQLFSVGQTPKPFRQNIEMKRGDWICPKCSFMNFARNIKCLECEEPRRKKQLTGREWDCPQCNFFNYGRNSVCLRCDCPGPGAPLPNINDLQSGSGYNGDYSYKANMDKRLAENEASDKDFPKIMPLRKGENRIVVSTRKTPLERRLSNPQHQNNSIDNGNLEGTNSMLDTSISRTLDHILGPSSSVFDKDDAASTPEKNLGTEFSPPLSQSGSADLQCLRSSDSGHSSSMPPTSDSFSKGDMTSQIDDGGEVSIEVDETVSSEVWKQTTMSNKSSSSGENFHFPKDSACQTDNQNKERELAEKSERWFKRVAELHNVKDLPSAVSDEDFPEIMPKRKGENQFVVSKKKDRSLASPKYRRQIAMDQANNSDFVPFVPFPPGYFARKGTEQSNSPDSPVKSTGEISPVKPMADAEKLDDFKYGTEDTSTEPRNDPKPSSSLNSNLSIEIVANKSNSSQIHNQAADLTSQFSGNNIATTAGSASNSSSTSRNINNNSWTDRYSATWKTSLNVTGGASSQLPKNESLQSSWTGKSLEGSTVEEPNPLDMSEEAKAERWFRRVAQINDISELSQIPEEDFPSIMPMRKGVNSFVVRKKKTPLERRLTSQQYRRNLPIVSTDSVKKESENS